MVLAEHISKQTVKLQVSGLGDILPDLGVAKVAVVSPDQDLLCLVVDAHAEVSPALHRLQHTVDAVFE